MHKLLLSFLFLAACHISMAQNVAINGDSTLPDNSAILDLKSNSKGLLVPRLSASDMASISLPAHGLLIFRTDPPSGFYYNNGLPAFPSWIQLATATQKCYGYVYNLTPQTVGIFSNVTFDNNGPLLGITHFAGSDNIIILVSGVYAITFSVSGTEPNQFGIFVNGNPTLSGTYGSGAGTQQNTGYMILNLAAGDIITLVNYFSAASVTIPTVTGGVISNVNASIMIQQL